MAKVNWGLIGCGDIARKRVAPALQDATDSELVAVSRARPEFAEAFAREFGAKKWFARWKTLLSDPDINAVYLATPVHLHAQQAIAAAEAGKHVLCEKPMALTGAQCEQMIRAADKNNVKLGVSYYRHFYPAIRRIKNIVASGEIGAPVLAQMNAFEWFDPPADHPRSWLLKRELSGGGPMFDFGCHRIEVLMNILGSVTNVKAIVGNVVFDRTVEDTAIASFQFDQGACAFLTVTHAAFEAQDTLDLFGSKGSVHVTNLNAGNLRIVTASGDRFETHPPAENLHLPSVQDFVSAVVQNREPAMSAAVGKAVNDVLERICNAN